ncbi:hypothetical protein DPMN_169842 [Dreissena polymorpha]|uniref:Uncharacterized protein n=1 Tax=Dreissena polymorpha TaxID=45954 RepID=A0A9D4IDQ5_DREPO|nr:hypothetical protein DPMN_169842 [Dreissena polymorpha]
MRQYKSDPFNKLKCNLVRDNLYIGNKVYNLDTGSLEAPKPKSRATNEKPYLQQTTQPMPYAQWKQQPKVPIDFRGQNRFEIFNSGNVDTPQRRRPLIGRSPRSPLYETELKRPREQDSESTSSTAPVQLPEIPEQLEPCNTQCSQLNSTVQ